MNSPAALDFNLLIEPVALRLLGEPAQKTPRVWRYGARGSLAIDVANARWFDYEANAGGGVLDLIRLQGHEDALSWLRGEGFLATPQRAPRIVETYDYRDEGGALLFQVVRLDPKDFRQRRPDGRWLDLELARHAPRPLPAARTHRRRGRRQNDLHPGGGEGCRKSPRRRLRRDDKSWRM